MMPDKWFGLCSFGGTVAIAHGDAAGVTPQLTGSQLCAAVPQVEAFGDIQCYSASNVGSPSVTFDVALTGLKWSIDAVKNGAQGIVVTHGTDTMEESAYFFDLFWPFEQPVVFTGAMRSPEEPGADGPANLLDAFIVANDESAHGLGALLVFNDEVFDAQTVTKTHSFAVDAFKSPWIGPIGRVHEGNLVIERRLAATRQKHFNVPDKVVNVPIVIPTLGCDGFVLKKIVEESECTGVVLAGMGAGHVPETYLPFIDDAVSRGVTIVMTTRTGGGKTGSCTYAYPGAEIDLLSRGVIFAGSLQPLKARLLLSVLLSNCATREEIHNEFLLRG